MAVNDAAQVLAQECADAMWATDRASQAMGIKVESVAPGKATISMAVRPEMIGPGGVCGRGAIFLLADSALAFAANTRGHRVVAQHCEIVFDNTVGVGSSLWRMRASGTSPTEKACTTCASRRAPAGSSRNCADTRIPLETASSSGIASRNRDRTRRWLSPPSHRLDHCHSQQDLDLRAPLFAEPPMSVIRECVREIGNAASIGKGGSRLARPGDRP